MKEARGESGSTQRNDSAADADAHATSLLLLNTSRLDAPPAPHGAGFFKGNPFGEPDNDVNHGGGGGGGVGGGGDGGDGGDRFTEQWNSTPHVPPPHKGQSQPSPQQPRADEEEPGAGEATKDGSVVARA